METATGVQVPPLPALASGSAALALSPPPEPVDSDDEFEDATSDDTLEAIDLNQAFVECEEAIKKFFTNDVHGAMDLMLPHAGTSLYHSLGSAIFAFIPAILTFDQNKIMEASAAIKTCISICNKNRKHRGIAETLSYMVKKPNYSLYSDQEAHAELCYAEALLLQAALTVIEGEDMTAFIKGTFKVRTCYNTYKHCSHMVQRKEWESEESRVHFESGVRLGSATFNLMISMLPSKFVALLEFAGFSGNRQRGLQELQFGSKEPGLRRVLCGMTLLAYHLVLQAFVGVEGDYKMCKTILHDALKMFPESGWFLVFKARYELLQGNLEVAVDIYKNFCETGYVGFREFRLLCYWELMWVSALMQDFRSSSVYAGHLMEQNAWSRTTYTYVKAAMLMHLGNAAAQADHNEVRKLMRDAARYKIRIAGKSLPMEKFAIKRCARYLVQQEKLILPALELLCIWNMLPMLKKNIPVLHKLLKRIEETREMAMCGTCAWMCGHESDNSALLYWMQGCVMLAMQMPRQAIQHFQQTVAFKKELKEDHFLIPYALVEMAMCYFNLGNYSKCKEILLEARRKYSGYSLESRLHFRIHARLQMLREDYGMQ